MLHNFSGFEGALSAPCVRVVNVAFIGFRELRFRWCLAFLHPLPTSFIQLVPCSDCAMLHIILPVSKVLFRHRVSGL